MPDWSASMKQTFEFYTVDPGTWKDSKRIYNIKSCNIERDLGTDTLGSGSFDVSEEFEECYIRVYLVTIQNGITEKHPLATLLVQTPSTSFDGMSTSISLDAYTPLLELKESPVPIGYYIPKKENIMDIANILTREHVRAPVVETEDDMKLEYDFVAETDEKWLNYISSLISNAKRRYDLDEMGRILFSTKQDLDALQPIWTYNDDNSSILHPQISLNRDLYGIPNVVEVIYSKDKVNYYSRVVNDDENSPISTVNRGREIIHRVTNPEISGSPNATYIKEYAEQLLKMLSTLEYTVSYTHGYCPVRIGDCVRLNYERAGIKGVKARVISQSISCVPGCPVSEKAVFIEKLWR